MENTKDLANKSAAAAAAGATAAFASVSNYFSKKEVDEEVPEDVEEFN